MRPRYLVAAASAMAIVGAMTGCGSSTADTSSTGPVSSEQGFTIGYAGAIQANPNNKAVEDGIRTQASELGMNVVVTDANLDPNKQIADVESLVAQGVDAIIIWPLDPNGIQAALDKARQANIPIIVQDTPDAGDVASNFQVNNFESAKKAAEIVAQEVGQGAEIGIIQGLPVVGVLIARNEGFAAGAQEAGLKVVAEQVNDKDSADGARPIVDAWKAKFAANLKGVLAYNDPSALGAASAVGGDFTPLVVGINGDAEGVAAVKDGRLLATFDFMPVELGNGLAWGAHQLLTGNTLPNEVNFEMKLIDKATADSWTPSADRLTSPMKVSIEERDGKSYLVVQ